MYRKLTVSALCMGGLGLTGCSNLSEIQKMPANQAITTAWQNTLSAPNFAYSLSSGVDALSLTSDNPETIKINQAINRLGKNFIFEAAGVIDNTNQRYDLTPTYRYDSQNLKFSVSLPIVYSGQQKALYANLSAFDGLLNASEHVGKYSRFDMSRFPVEEKSGKIVAVLKKFQHAYYDGMNASAFSELPLTDADKGQHIVRKIQVKSNPSQVFEHMPMLLNDFVDLFKVDPKQDSVSKDSIALQAKLEQSIEGNSQLLPSKKLMDELAKMIDPASEQIEVFGFNKAGQLVENEVKSNVIIAPEASRSTTEKTGLEAIKGIRMSSHSRMRVYDYGVAKPTEPLTAENTVDGFENLKGSLLGQTFVDRITPHPEAAEAAQAAKEAAEAAEPVIERHARRPKHAKVKRAAH